jgi:sigma-B regulation protein RsbU (phosphoserine phosphatase)
VTTYGADGHVPLADDAESLFDGAPCGYLTLRPDGEVVRANATFLRWTGYDREELTGIRFASLLTRGAQIFYETNALPLLLLQGSVQELALDLRRRDGTLLSALVNATLERGPDGAPDRIRVAVFDATLRRSYERDLVRMRDDDRQIAQLLQQSLLAGDPPHDPRIEIASYYAASVEGLKVGGDWFDAFPTTPGRISLVVGDVVGTGLGAASAMGRLRSAVRAHAVAGIPPAELLELLDAFVAIDEGTRYATVVYLDLELESGIATMASAGHPPALLLEPDGRSELLWDGRSAPLGSYGKPFARRETRVELAAEARLLLYTDGLVERRADALDVGFARLAAASAASAGRTLAGQLEAIVETLTGDEPTRDDVCLLAVRRVPA